ncbi:zinc ABC transporter substrate-binding protein AztC [Pseudonocardia kunmingensis]|uniref:Zinc/manganese transport system substrate-binding protein n=1 Tax=Pseudonocardia kunmingensis TaxID=630975 RepID=A0A543DNF7_9PSEU|nr:zinc ABC transporter substrate-binding protein AztC [Pseudonocardia kunmingensis]TQM10874.1 zinc/manganese transport system substrate-binding protein [Pseudonocardia kunmingensis]
MRRRAFAALVGVLLLALAGCGQVGQERTVVVTTNILGDVTRNIVGDQAEVTVLMAPNADPHSFGVSAQQAAQLERAGLVVHNGLGLEEGVQRHVDAARDAGVATFAAAEAVDPIAFATDGSAGNPDPHFWTDPQRVRRVVDLVADEVVAHVEGVDEAAVRANAARYGAAVDELDAALTAQFARIPDERRKLVTNHHVFGYLAQRYGFEVVGAVIPSGTTLASPSAADLESLATAVRTAGVPAVFADSSQPDRLARVLADRAGVHVAVVPLFSESLTDEGGGAATYLQMMRANADAIARGLGATP